MEANYRNLDINTIPLEGTPEHTQELNSKLVNDLNIYRTRPFLNKTERNNLGEYYCTWGINNFIALFNFDRDGNYLPNIYSAPRSVSRLLYPIDDIMQYARQGTLVIDREQYNPELRNLSFFIYMVDAELYDQYKEAQHFNGPTAPTFMFNKFANNGVRIFRDYFALARHLRKQRFVTYILGPRTAFYLRYFIHQIHVHTVDNDYAFGEKQDPTIANDVVNSIRRHLAFNTTTKTTYKVDITDDPVKNLRILASVFKMNKLPEPENFHCQTDIIRYAKQKLGTGVYHVKKNKLKKYPNIPDYCNVTFVDGGLLAFVWDTRKVIAFMPKDDYDIEDFCKVKWDNGFDLACPADASQEIRQACEANRLKTAIQMRDLVPGINC